MAAPSRLVEIADELYGLVPGEFIAARDAAVRAARDGADRELADQVKALRKPSVGAWLADKLVRDEPAELDELLDLGQAMRDARDALDGAKLRSMSRERHAIVRSLIERATALAAQDDQRAGDPAQRELEVTLDAVLADEQAADAFRTGRLVRGLTATGLEPVDVTDAVAVPEAAAPARRGKARSRPTPEPKPKKSATRTATKQQGKQQAARERAVTDARAAVDDAEADRARREEELRSAQHALDAARERVTELERELRAATTERARAETACHEADAAHRAATRKRDTARRAFDAAQRRASD
jgi:hypothetical protein